MVVFSLIILLLIEIAPDCFLLGFQMITCDFLKFSLNLFLLGLMKWSIVMCHVSIPCLVDKTGIFQIACFLKEACCSLLSVSNFEIGMNYPLKQIDLDPYSISPSTPPTQARVVSYLEFKIIFAFIFYS